jgi:hypothetical protein
MWEALFRAFAVMVGAALLSYGANCLRAYCNMRRINRDLARIRATLDP